MLSFILTPLSEREAEETILQEQLRGTDVLSRHHQSVRQRVRVREQPQLDDPLLSKIPGSKLITKYLP